MNREIREFGPPRDEDRGEWKIAIWKNLETGRCVARVEMLGMVQEVSGNHAFIARFNNVNPAFCDKVVTLIDQKPCKNAISPEVFILQSLVAQ